MEASIKIVNSRKDESRSSAISENIIFNFFYSNWTILINQTFSLTHIKTICYCNKYFKLLHEKLLNKNLSSEMISSELYYCNINYIVV